MQRRAWPARFVWVLASIPVIIAGLGAVFHPRIHPPAGPLAASQPVAMPTAAEQVWRGRLAYAAQTADGLTIHVLAAGDDQPRALITGHSPAWSPDGTQIAFVSERSGVAQIYLMNATGQSLTQLTHSQEAKSNPAWSPQGRSIALLAHTGDETALQLVDSLGTTTRDLSDLNARHVEHFSWAPDGQELLFDVATGNGHESGGCRSMALV